MIKFKLFSTEIVDKKIVLSRTEYSGKIIKGSNKSNDLYGTYLHSARVENRNDPSIKMIVMAKSYSQTSNRDLVGNIVNWFSEQRVDNINSSVYIHKLSSYIHALQENKKDNSNTSLGLAICNNDGDAIIYNVGSLMHHLKMNDSNGILDVTYLDPTGTAGANFEGMNGSFYFYSNVSEIYITSDTVPFSHIEDIANKRLSIHDKARLIAEKTYYHSDSGNIDIGAAVMKIKKR